jgi:hypothetical protein
VVCSLAAIQPSDPPQRLFFNEKDAFARHRSSRREHNTRPFLPFPTLLSRTRVDAPLLLGVVDDAKVLEHLEELLRGVAAQVKFERRTLKPGLIFKG